jgi:hypothetical protein
VREAKDRAKEVVGPAIVCRAIERGVGACGEFGVRVAGTWSAYETMDNKEARAIDVHPENGAVVVVPTLPDRAIQGTITTPYQRGVCGGAVSALFGERMQNGETRARRSARFVAVIWLAASWLTLVS